LKVALAVSASRVYCEAAKSSLLRAYEEFDFDRYVLLHTPNASKCVDELLDISKSLNLEVERVEVPGDERPLYERFSKIRNMEFDLALVSSAGSALGSLVSKVSKDLAHVTYPFSLWSGLNYPFVPRPFQVLYTLSRRTNAKIKRVLPEKFLEASGIKPQIGNLVAKINYTNKTSVLNACKGFEVRVELGIPGASENVTVDLCKDESEKIFNFGKNLERHLKPFGRGSNSVLRLSGVLPTEPEEVGNLLLDTSAVLLGGLNWRSFGANVKVPLCAVYELLHMYMERAKPGGVELIPSLGALLVEELKDFIYPSTTDFCDKAFLQIEPILLKDLTIVTDDSGIKKLWNYLNMGSLAKVVGIRKVKHIEDLKFVKYNKFFSFYALLQLYVLLKSYAKEAGGGMRGRIVTTGTVVDEF